MRFAMAILLAVALAGGARAIHPPMEPPPTPPTSTTGGGSSSGGGGQVQITSLTPEPAAMTLAVIGLLGGGTYRLIRRKK